MAGSTDAPLKTETLREAWAWVLHRVIQRRRSVIAFSLAFKLLSVSLLAPLAAATLRLCLVRWGRASVGNFEIATFFLSPAGLLALVGVGSILLATLYLELAGLLRLLADSRLTWWEAFRSSPGMFPRLVALGLRQLVFYLLLAAPCVAGTGLVYWLLWSDRDLNGLIILRPPVFWWGVGLAGALAAIYGWLALRLFLSWLYAVPTLLFEPRVSVSESLARSVQHSRGQLRRMAGALTSWLLVQAALGTVVLGVLAFVSDVVLHRTGASLATAIMITGAVLAAQALAATFVSMFSNVTLAGVILWLYRLAAGPLRSVEEQEPFRDTTRVTGWSWGVVSGAVLVLATALTTVASFELIRHLELQEDLQITAHRAGATHAPENTVAALKRAIADRADWAEIDVQLTSDNQLVVTHDLDLARVGGGSRRVDQATLAEIQALDVGTLFGSQFAAERIPTLEQMLAAAGDQIRLNVELKPHSHADGDALTRRVIEAIRGAGMLRRCRLCSQSYASLQLARQLEPGLPVGFIVATALGDPTQLEANFLMVESKRATRDLVERARLRDLEIHAWTVNDPNQLAPLLDSGIANLITDDPARMRARLDEIRGLNPIERLLLRARNALAD